MDAKLIKNTKQKNISELTYVDDVQNGVACIYNKGMYHYVSLHVEYDDWLQNKVDSLNSHLTYDEIDRVGEYTLSSFENSSTIEGLAMQFFLESDEIKECTTKILTYDEYIND